MIRTYFFESHYVAESAYSAAEILSGEGDNAAAHRLYILAAERLEYHEVKAELNEIYKRAKERVSK